MNKFILITIIVLASVLRLYSLSDYPAGFNADEAALGYNSYSLLLTGKDEHGHPWPINLESFGDFKPALYAYILLPFIKILGLTEFAVRLPSALFGVAAVLGIYLLVKTIFKNEAIALISSLFLAISPWHLHFSRGGWEVNVATTFLIFGTWLLITWTKRQRIYLLLASIGVFILSMYTYQSARIIAPLLFISFSLVYFKNYLTLKKQTLVGILTGLVMCLPLLVTIFTSDASSRFSGVGFLADKGPLSRVNELRGQHQPWNSIVSKSLHNQPLAYSLQFFQNYLDHFNSTFLFISGDVIKRNNVPQMGLLYLSDFILIGLGLIYLLKTFSKNSLLIMLWLLISPIAAALTFQTPHALRAQNMVVPLTIISSIGLYYLFSMVKTSKLKYITTILVVLIYSYQITNYIHEYYVHYPLEMPDAWQYGFKELVNYIAPISNNYSQVYITDVSDQPYILFLFYSQYPPQLFQSNHRLTFRDQYNFSTVRSYTNYNFISIDMTKLSREKNILIVASPKELTGKEPNFVKNINYPNGQAVFTVISQK